MPTFSELERAYLAEPRLGRLATADSDGRPHVVPTGFRFDPDAGVIQIGGHNLAATKKYRDVQANPHAAFVVDELISVSPWQVRGIEIRGEAQAIEEGGDNVGPGFGGAWIRITPTRVVSWGLENGS
ncbi:MAG: PPOX class F420-dependent oxidoreductase [Thermomicrobiales bacterium]